MLPEAGPRVPPPEINSHVIQNIYFLSYLNRMTKITVQTVVIGVKYIYGFFLLQIFIDNTLL